MNKITSTLSLLLQNPLATSVRIGLGIPFLYQKVSTTMDAGAYRKIMSKTQVSVTIATKTHLDSFVIVRLDGRIDWIVTQRNALVAWTGPLLTPRPKIIRSHVPHTIPRPYITDTGSSHHGVAQNSLAAVLLHCQAAASSKKSPSPKTKNTSFTQSLSISSLPRVHLTYR
jgi:hypothetical protein